MSDFPKILLEKPWAELTDDEIIGIMETLKSHKHVVLQFPRYYGKDTIAKAMHRLMEEE